MAITLRRGPRTSNQWSGPGFNPKILPIDDGIALDGTINYGQGETEVQFQIDCDSFADLAHAMMKVNKNAAVKAFGQALSEGID